MDIGYFLRKRIIHFLWLNCRRGNSLSTIKVVYIMRPSYEWLYIFFYLGSKSSISPIVGFSGLSTFRSWCGDMMTALSSPLPSIWSLSILSRSSYLSAGGAGVRGSVSPTPLGSLGADCSYSRDPLALLWIKNNLECHKLKAILRTVHIRNALVPILCGIIKCQIHNFLSL